MPRIAAFTKDWNDVPTCTTHILREMGRTMPVLWIESIGTRKPSLAAARDLVRIVRRLRAALHPVKAKENHLTVLTPLVIPKAESAVARGLNRFLMRRAIAGQFGGPAEGRLEYWCFVPSAVDFLPPRTGGRRTTEDPLIVYYCVDDWTKFEYLDGEWTARKERELLAAADVVFATSRVLETKCRSLARGPVHYMPHGVNHRGFAAALLPEMRVPEDLAALRKPVIGFYGNVYPWIDFELIGRLAAARQDWSFVLIGGVFCDVSNLSRHPNVHFLGRREYTELPAYCKGFDVAMIPYDLGNPRMESVNPVKTREMLSAGVPIVGCDIEELHGFGEDVVVCRDPESWLAALARQMARSDRAAISKHVENDDWSCRLQTIRAQVEAAAAE